MRHVFGEVGTGFKKRYACYLCKIEDIHIGFGNSAKGNGFPSLMETAARREISIHESERIIIWGWEINRLWNVPVTEEKQERTYSIRGDALTGICLSRH